MQTWPALTYPPVAVAAATWSRSASGRTMSGQLAPSSSERRLTPATRVICSPTAVEPVKLIFRTRGSAQSTGPSSEPEPVRHWIAFSGNPASSSLRVRNSAVSGVCRAGLSTTALPAASAGPTLWMTSMAG